ncbi:MAG: hypothetical protein GTO67_11225, partial [Gammaproteobacteria bacterium]|nr:hypothetical protein [Gammaproteobacteria bacterium]NIN39179.1 hypothetical protein [Gammaproteobacteria bacterium]NIO24012.1 hypothetical protein [Gammaproteobacteria bacterium]NIO64664.1 hypothetical protein [Gammaproteobacteria bacterium]NIP63446.1 hypothetical protein [Gammaproteobacteria bacterium]
RIDARLDRKGDRIDARLDRKGNRAHARLDRRASRHHGMRSAGQHHVAGRRRR